MQIEQRIEEFLKANGAVAVGFATKETLKNSPPSADLEYVLPGARSAVSFAIPLDKEAILKFLAKIDDQAHITDQQIVYGKTNDLSLAVAEMLREEGYEAVETRGNGEQRFDSDDPDYLWSAHPPISHRYMAVASGVGTFGFSGVVGIDGYGGNILLGSTVTTAELQPTAPIPQEDSWCDDCKFCVATCPTKFIEPQKQLKTTLGGIEYEHAARKGVTPELCVMGCSGFTGLHHSGRWSTYSPGRFEVPEDVTTPEGKKAIRKLVVHAGKMTGKRPQPVSEITDAVTFNNKLLSSVDLRPSCGHCQLVCFGTHEERKQALDIIKRSDCVIQLPDGSLEVLPADEALIKFEELDQETKAIYTNKVSE